MKPYLPLIKKKEFDSYAWYSILCQRNDILLRFLGIPEFYFNLLKFLRFYVMQLTLCEAMFFSINRHKFFFVIEVVDGTFGKYL